MRKPRASALMGRPQQNRSPGPRGTKPRTDTLRLCPTKEGEVFGEMTTLTPKKKTHNQKTHNKKNPPQNIILWEDGTKTIPEISLKKTGKELHHWNLYIKWETSVPVRRKKTRKEGPETPTKNNWDLQGLMIFYST